MYLNKVHDFLLHFSQFWVYAVMENRCGRLQGILHFFSKLIKCSRFSLEVQYGHLTLLTDNKYTEVMVASSGSMPINLPYLLWCLTFYYFTASDQRASWSAVSNIANVSISLDAQCNLEAYYCISLVPTCSIFKEREWYSFYLSQFIPRGYF